MRSPGDYTYEELAMLDELKEQKFSDAVKLFLDRLEADGVDSVSVDVVRKRWLPEIEALEMQSATE